MIKKTFFLIGSMLFLASFLMLNSCGIYRPVSAKDYPPDPKLRVKKNIEEGRGFRLMGGKKKGGTFDFASSNELWRAALDTIDFMPFTSSITSMFRGTFKYFIIFYTIKSPSAFVYDPLIVLILSIAMGIMGFIPW